MPLSPAPEFVMMIEPPPAARRWGMAAFTVCHTPVRLTSITSCQACSVSSSAVPKLTMPALATTMSSRPSRATPSSRAALSAVVVADVGLAGDDAAVEASTSTSFDLSGRHGSGRVDLRRDVDGDDVGALFGQPDGVAAALTPRGAGDEGDFSF